MTKRADAKWHSLFLYRAEMRECFSGVGDSSPNTADRPAHHTLGQRTVVLPLPARARRERIRFTISSGAALTERHPVIKLSPNVPSLGGLRLRAVGDETSPMWTRSVGAIDLLVAYVGGAGTVSRSRARVFTNCEPGALAQEAGHHRPERLVAASRAPDGRPIAGRRHSYRRPCGGWTRISRGDR